MITHFIRVATAAVTFVFVATAAHAADPAVSCESGKLKASGKYASCILASDAKSVTTGNPADYAKCDEKLDKSWSTAETKGMGMCPGGAGDQTDVQAFLDACTQSLTAALDGAPLIADPISCSQDLDTCDTSLTTCDADLTTCDADLTTCDADLTTCEGDLAVCEATSGGLPKTGQTTCYNAAGTVIACAGTGQDGELQKGVARSFTDNGDGTVTDDVTGLMWEKLSDDGSIHDKDTTYTWTNAFASKVATLNSGSFAGYSDWRVPNSFELFSLVSHGAVNPSTYSAFNSACAPACTVTTCSCTTSSNYWSSTTYAYDPTFAWNVTFFDGSVFDGFKPASLYVRAVRGGS